MLLPLGPLPDREEKKTRPESESCCNIREHYKKRLSSYLSRVSPPTRARPCFSKNALKREWQLAFPTAFHQKKGKAEPGEKETWDSGGVRDRQGHSSIGSRQSPSAFPPLSNHGRGWNNGRKRRWKQENGSGVGSGGFSGVFGQRRFAAGRGVPSLLPRSAPACGSFVPA